MHNDNNKYNDNDTNGIIMWLYYGNCNSYDNENVNDINTANGPGNNIHIKSNNMFYDQMKPQSWYS